MQADWPASRATVLRVDGGMTASHATLQFLADITGAPVDRPAVMETTALGAAYLAGFQAGTCPDFETFGRTWRLDRRFVPEMAPDVRERRYAGWLDVVRRTTTTA
jgi:glycerol kinase